MPHAILRSLKYSSCSPLQESEETGILIICCTNEKKTEATLQFLFQCFCIV